MGGGLIGVFFAAPNINFLDLDVLFGESWISLPCFICYCSCGAISGFHSIVGSGTTAKQLNKESDGKIIGYGGMLIEGMLARVLSLIAVSSMVNSEFINILTTKGPVTAFSPLE